MASGKLIKGILGLFDEELPTKILGRDIGKSLAGSGAKLRSKSPVRGILSRELTKEEVHPDIWNAAFGDPLPTGYAPLYRGFHGTNSRVPFSRPIGGLRDLGVSMTSSPDVADFHALGRYDVLSGYGMKGPPQGAPGARVYPLLADPGNVMPFPRDVQDWSSPRRVLTKTINDPNYDESVHGMSDTMDAMAQGRPLDETLAGLGYQSVEYPHMNPWFLKSAKRKSIDPKDIAKVSGRGLTVFDSTRVVPEFSEVGQRAAKTRGVLSAEKSVRPNATAKDLGKLYGQNATPEETAEHLFDPNNSRLGRMEHLSEDLSLAKSDGEINDVLAKIKDLANVTSPGGLTDHIKNMGYILETLDAMKNVKKAATLRRMIGILKRAKKK